MQLSRAQAEAFYAVHAARPFFKDLVEFMISGPVVAQVLQGENAVLKNRDIMGATDPKKAAAGTIRAEFANRSKPIPCTAPTPRKPRCRKSRSSSPASISSVKKAGAF